MPYPLSQYGGMASGLTGGVYIISTSVFSFVVVKIIHINNQTWLGVGYTVLILGVLALVLRTKWLESARKQDNLVLEQEPELMME